MSVSLSHLEPYVTLFIFLDSGTLVMEMFGRIGGWLVGCGWRDWSRAETGIGIHVDGGVGRWGSIKAVRWVGGVNCPALVRRYLVYFFPT